MLAVGIRTFKLLLTGSIPIQMGTDGARPYGALAQGRITLLGDACHPTLPFLDKARSWRSRTPM